MEALAGELVFASAAAAAARPAVGGHAGVRAVMARAAQLLRIDAHAGVDAGAGVAATRRASNARSAASLRPARRRTRRYAERHAVTR